MQHRVDLRSKVVDRVRVRTGTSGRGIGDDGKGSRLRAEGRKRLSVPGTTCEYDMSRHVARVKILYHTCDRSLDCERCPLSGIRDLLYGSGAAPVKVEQKFVCKAHIYYD